MKLKTFLLPLGFSTLAFSSLANAGVIDFDSDPSFHYPSTNNEYIENGFSFKFLNGTGVFWGTEAFNADPGGNTLTVGTSMDTFDLIITRVDGGSFDLKSIDLADRFNTGAPDFASGYLGLWFYPESGPDMTTEINLDNLAGLETFHFDVSNITKIAIDKWAWWEGGLQIDNLVFALPDDNEPPVDAPEPSSLALLMLGLGGVMLRHRKQQKA